MRKSSSGPFIPISVKVAYLEHHTAYTKCLPLLCYLHRLVLETLEPLPQDRKCFRMINGVLVERTVKDVVPALKTNSEGLRKVLDELLKQYKRQQDEMEKWKVNFPGRFCHTRVDVSELSSKRNSLPFRYNLLTQW